MSWNAPRPFDQALAELQARAWEPARADRPELVDRVAIKMAHAVFQPRTFSEELAKDEAHIRELVRALKAKPKDARYFDPMLVMAIGRAFYVVNGHHRLLAYERAGVDGPVPVQHFEGTIEDAVREAARCNSKDTLAMTKQDKLEAAWRLVLLGKHSRRQISEATTVATRTVDNMRGTLKKLPKGRRGALKLTWAKAKEIVTGERVDWTDEKRLAQVREWARRLARTFGSHANLQPGVLADALELYSRALPAALIEEWVETAKLIVAALEDDEAADPPHGKPQDIMSDPEGEHSAF